MEIGKRERGTRSFAEAAIVLTKALEVYTRHDKPNSVQTTRNYLKDNGIALDERKSERSSLRD